MKHFFITASLILFALTATAQHKDFPNWEDLQAKKIAHITEKVQFTAKEAQQFWTLYNEYLEKETTLKKDFFEIQKRRKTPTTSTTKHLTKHASNTNKHSST
ncbi:MAG: hypothetical protein J6U44_03400, partial [Paludibacteraceae bacterium]|nr:hypothetical protein [Paludibacteraceae bacterium]